MIKGKRNLLFDLTPTLPHVPHHSLSALLTRPFPSFSLSLSLSLGNLAATFQFIVVVFVVSAKRSLDSLLN